MRGRGEPARRSGSQPACSGVLDVKTPNASRLALTELAPDARLYARPAAERRAWRREQFRIFINGFCASFIFCCIL